jgi:cell division protein FtsW
VESRQGRAVAVREREGCDRPLFVITIFLLLLGLVVVLDASSARAAQSSMSGYDSFYFFKRQAMWVGIALVTLFLAMHTPYWKLKDARFWLLGTLACLALLVLVLLPGIGIEVNGSRRWLGLGFMRFQPSEFAKIALVVFLARYAELWQDRVRHFSKGFLPPVVVVLAIGGLVAKEDLGTAITIVVTGVLMIYMMGARLRHVSVLGVLAVAAGVVMVIIKPYRLERIWAWTSVLFDPIGRHDGVAYQPAQGLIALGSGGVWGQGWARGVAKHMYLPAEHTDYVFATIGEEAGLVGCVLLLGLFGWLIVRGLTIAHRSGDSFASLLAAGLTIMIGAQALLNIAVVTCIVPCTGVPLPFISYGGSSVVFTALAMGIILSVSKSSDRGIRSGKARQSRESRTDGRGNRGAHIPRTERRPLSYR